MIVKTFRFRLTLFYTVIVVVMFSVFAYVIYHEFRKELLGAVDKNLLKDARVEVQKGLDPKDLAENEEIIKKYGGQYYRVVTQNGEVMITTLDRNQKWPLDMKSVQRAFSGSAVYETSQYKEGKIRILYFPVSEENILRIGDSLEDRERAVEGLERLFLLFFPFILGGSSLMSWFLAGKSLDPVIKITSLAEQIRHGKLGERIDMGLKGKEIDDLVVIFNEMLENIQHSMQAQTRFTSDVSHEIRSPLTSLRGNMEVALRKKRTPDEYEEVLRSNLSDIIRLSKITDNLLFLSRADHNILELRMQWFDLKHLLESTVERLRPKAAAAGLTVSEDYQKEIEMRGDLDLLEQAFANLIDNAIKYTPRGGKILVTLKELDDSITVTVSDTGLGIPEGDIPHIFDRFYRVNKERSRKLGGTGLGLAITKWIVAAHNGDIVVKSTVGSGSDFAAVFQKPHG